ncbi:hypothetical protein Acr_08g0014810 [Actinidia rufa]|uniref:Uncharacterized protein n=1 Tax=Actinidia rufa TaxID=165716 RepID=A0A7J0F315_9ERIC|nr:hypothetical protein Acr_08g0014810 [Actinidia rufa]
MEDQNEEGRGPNFAPQNPNAILNPPMGGVPQNPLPNPAHGLGGDNMEGGSIHGGIGAPQFRTLRDYMNPPRQAPSSCIVFPTPLRYSEHTTRPCAQELSWISNLMKLIPIFDYLANLTRDWASTGTQNPEGRPNQQGRKYQLKEVDDVNARLATMARKLEALEFAKVNAVGGEELKEVSCAVCETKEHDTISCPVIPAPHPPPQPQNYQPSPVTSFSTLPKPFQPPPQAQSNTYQPPHKRSLEDTLQQFIQSQGGMLELNHQIQQNKLTLESLQNLAGILKRFEAIEKIEDALTGLKIIECEGNYIRLSLRTCPNSESLFSQHKIEDITEPLELNHELLIEVVEGTLELKGVEIFPNDVYIGEIIDAAKSFRMLFPNMSMLDARSSLEWFVRQVQDRIVLCSMRRLLGKYANKSRHSFEYLDRDDIVVAHKVGGVDAYIKMSHGWPVSNQALKLISLKSSGHSSKEISLSFLCKVEEEANSLDADTRQNISSFVDAIEEILMQRMRAELQYEKNSEK